jgi:pentatricopeptide repeat protein
MEVFQEMVHKNCERSVITYSSLISACEKAGQWQLALELFNEMHAEGCVPNTVTFNSLITACAQGAFASLNFCSRATHILGPRLPAVRHSAQPIEAPVTALPRQQTWPGCCKEALDVWW